MNNGKLTSITNFYKPTVAYIQFTYRPIGSYYNIMLMESESPQKGVHIMLRHTQSCETDYYS